jgi:hypothetical protein
MTLFEKLVDLYPTLTPEDFRPALGTIRLQNDSDGKGDYIAVWDHPTLARPTEQELA